MASDVKRRFLYRTSGACIFFGNSEQIGHISNVLDVPTFLKTKTSEEEHKV